MSKTHSVVEEQKGVQINDENRKEIKNEYQSRNFRLW